MLLVFQLIRRRKLREEYALLWFVAGLLLIVASFWRGGLELAARLAGVAYPPSLIYLGAILIGFILAMHFSIALSRLAEENKRLAQEVALLKQQMDARDTGDVAGQLTPVELRREQHGTAREGAA